MTDRKAVNIFSASVFAALLAILFVPFSESGRIVAASLLLPAAILANVFIKKRNIPSINKRQILLIMTVFALVYVMLYYLSGIKFGFYINPYRLSVSNLFKFLIPITAIIVSEELMRFIIVSQKSKLAIVLCYFSCVFAETIIVSTFASVGSFSRFMELMAGALFPAVISNLLYNYLAKRYGIYPNLAYRAVTTLHTYIFSVSSGISPSLLTFIKLIVPIVIFVFIDALYEKKKRRAIGGNSRVLRVAGISIGSLVLIFMIGIIMLISNQFRYGSLVIATESMTDEINKGDVVIYESLDNQVIEKGQIIAFERNDSVVVHRVIDIEIINGTVRYYTKGDANENADSGYITDTQIVGVVKYKLPSLGYPSLWMRSLFKK